MKYKLVPILPQNKIFEVFINADANDGDYRSTLTTYTEEEFNTDIVDDLILLKSKCSGYHELPRFDYIVEDEYNRCTKLDIPYADLDCTENCHTLKELKIICIDTDGKAFNVNLDDFV